MISRFRLMVCLISLMLCIGFSYAQVPPIVITLDSSNLGETSSATPTISYSLAVNAGQSISIEIISVTDGFFPQGVVFDANGTLLVAIANSGNSPSSSASLTTQQNTNLLIQVSGVNGTVGEFVLRASEGIIPPAIPTATTSPANTVINSLTCDDVIDQATDVIYEACGSTSRNEVCYGNVNADITARTGRTLDRFEHVGDIVPLADVANIELTAFDELTGEWGVALMRVQANLPDTLPGQNVTVLAFGGVSLNNASSDSPMQSFYFTGNVGIPQCGETPASGIVINTPEGVGTVEMQINQMTMRFGSTVLLEAIPQDALRVTTLEGTAEVEFLGEVQVARTGQQVAVPIDNNALPLAPPLPPVDVPIDRLIPALPLPPDNNFDIATPSPITPLATATPSQIELPTTGACVLTTFENDATVNIRTVPNTSASTNGFIEATRTYNVIGRNSDSTWYQISRGWVAAFVTRRGGDCTNVPITYIPPTPTPTVPPYRLAPDTEAFLNVDYNGLSNTVSGAISFPDGDTQDTITYVLINVPEGRLSSSRILLSITCTGDTAHAIIVFDDGSVRDCSSIPSNFQDLGTFIDGETRRVTIQFDSGVPAGAYVDWQVTVGFVG